MGSQQAGGLSGGQWPRPAELGQKGPAKQPLAALTPSTRTASGATAASQVARGLPPTPVQWAPAPPVHGSHQRRSLLKHGQRRDRRLRGKLPERCRRHLHNGLRRPNGPQCRRMRRWQLHHGQQRDQRLRGRLTGGCRRHLRNVLRRIYGHSRCLHGRAGSLSVHRRLDGHGSDLRSTRLLHGQRREQRRRGRRPERCRRNLHNVLRRPPCTAVICDGHAFVPDNVASNGCEQAARALPPVPAQRVPTPPRAWQSLASRSVFFRGSLSSGDGTNIIKMKFDAAQVSSPSPWRSPNCKRGVLSGCGVLMDSGVLMARGVDRARAR